MTAITGYGYFLSLSVILPVDFHYHPLFSAKVIGDAVHLVNQLSPAIVVLTGDLVTIPFFGSRHKTKLEIQTQAEPCAGLLSQLRAKQGLALNNVDDVDMLLRFEQQAEPRYAGAWLAIAEGNIVTAASIRQQVQKLVDTYGGPDNVVEAGGTSKIF